MDEQQKSLTPWLLGGSVVIVLVLIGAYFWFSHPAKVPPQPTPTLPSALSQGSTGGATTTATMTITAKLGPVVTTDFIHNGKTWADVENHGTYYLAGSPDHCLTSANCLGGAPSTDYNITYDSAHQSFIVALLAEPLGKVRKEAEQFMLDTLGINKTQLCTLNYYVGTVSAFNDFYAGKNLGFSFCPNATVLPE